MPATYSVPSVATVSVPQIGELGIVHGPWKRTPSGERLNVFGAWGLPAVLHAWYWNPLPVLVPRSIVIHCLSPPKANTLAPQVAPPSLEGKIWEVRVSIRLL